MPESPTATSARSSSAGRRGPTVDARADAADDRGRAAVQARVTAAAEPRPLAANAGARAAARGRAGGRRARPSRGGRRRDLVVPEHVRDGHHPPVAGDEPRRVVVADAHGDDLRRPLRRGDDDRREQRGGDERGEPSPWRPGRVADDEASARSAAARAPGGRRAARAAARSPAAPSRAAAGRSVVSEMWCSAARKVLSKPTIETSCGTRTPSSSSRSSTPAPIRSLAAKIAVGRSPCGEQLPRPRARRRSP